MRTDNTESGVYVYAKSWWHVAYGYWWLTATVCFHAEQRDRSINWPCAADEWWDWPWRSSQARRTLPSKVSPQKVVKRATGLWKSVNCLLWYLYVRGFNCNRAKGCRLGWNSHHRSILQSSSINLKHSCFQLSLYVLTQDIISWRFTLLLISCHWFQH